MCECRNRALEQLVCSALASLASLTTTSKYIYMKIILRVVRKCFENSRKYALYQHISIVVLAYYDTLLIRLNCLLYNPNEKVGLYERQVN